MSRKIRFAGAAILIKDKKIFLIKRPANSPYFPEHWACPGGRGKEGELPEEVVARELKEELGINFHPRQFFSEIFIEGYYLRRYLGDWSGDFNLNKEEVADSGWFIFEEAIKLKLAGDYTQILEELYRKKYLK